MTIEFRCVNCRRLLRVGDDAANRLAQCPECGTQMPVPAVSTPQELPEPTQGVPPSSGRGPADYGPTPPGYFYVRVDGGKAILSLLLGVAGLMLSLFGFCCGCVAYLTLVMAAIGLVLGIQALRTDDRLAAIAGIAFCSVVLALSLAAILLHGLAAAVMHGPHFMGR